MPNNWKQAEQTDFIIPTRLSEFRYKAYIDNIICEGLAHQVPTEDLQQNNGYGGIYIKMYIIPDE